MSFAPSPSVSRSLVRKNSIVGVEVVNLVLRSKNTPPRSKRVVEGGSEEVTLLLGRRKGEDLKRKNEEAQQKREEERKREERKLALQVREKEEVNLAMALKAASVQEKLEKTQSGPKLAQEVTLVLGKGDQVVSLSISGENETEVVNLSLSTEVNLSISGAIEELQPAIEEEVTLSLSTDISIGPVGKEWTVENGNKYGSVLMVCMVQSKKRRSNFFSFFSFRFMHPSHF
jgi:hypothetical protein